MFTNTILFPLKHTNGIIALSIKCSSGELRVTMIKLLLWLSKICFKTHDNFNLYGKNNVTHTFFSAVKLEKYDILVQVQCFYIIREYFSS